MLTFSQTCGFAEKLIYPIHALIFRPIISRDKIELARIPQANQLSERNWHPVPGGKWGRRSPTAPKGTLVRNTTQCHGGGGWGDDFPMKVQDSFAFKGESGLEEVGRF